MELFSNQAIVVPLDFSGESLQAVRLARNVAEDPAQIHLVHVYQPPTYTAYGFTWGPPPEATVHEEAIGTYFTEYVEEHDIADLKRTLRAGDAGKEISQFALDINAGLVIIPSHGYHGFKHAILGSVAERVLRMSHCPVLVLRRSDAD